ncbi:hypothetical protein BOX15_Mlig028482g1 [Macrostomum lignano]|uniref:Uncharacterized protein n=1 Tax=Macrostomum lignano TaxID=282301 RepID=A0A267E0T5_9PLAT|nr:hypothetical protein BOX15_Mlig028482g1 [Macrostomum lignano]
MWEDDGSSDFGRQANGDSNGSESTGALDLGHSELMYGTFMDPAAAWAGQYDLNQLQHQHQHLQYQHQHQQSLQFSVGHSSEQDEAARAAAGIEGSAMIQAGIIEDQEAAAAAAASGPHQLRLQVQQQQQRQQQLPSVPELASWWGSNANGRQAAATSSGAASTSVWAPDQQHQQLANQPSETVSEREFIIVRKAKASINWDGSPVADASVVYECRICGRQCAGAPALACTCARTQAASRTSAASATTDLPTAAPGRSTRRRLTAASYRAPRRLPDSMAKCRQRARRPMLQDCSCSTRQSPAI